MIVNKYEIFSEKVSDDVNIGVFADVHCSNTFKMKRFELIKENLFQNKPDYICIPGDIIDMTNILDKKENYDKFLGFFEDVGKIAPTFISLGSHDFSRLTKGKWSLDYNEAWFRELSQLDNIVLLHNSVYNNKDINFIGYTPTYNYYYNKSGKEDENILIDDLKKQNFSFNDEKLNILLCHSPMCISNDNVIKNIEFLKNVRLILSGHMHNGMVHNPVAKIINNNKGFMDPNKDFFPDNARGIKEFKVDDHDTTIVITGGITKISEAAPKILHFGDYLYSPQMDYVKVRKK